MGAQDPGPSSHDVKESGCCSRSLEEERRCLKRRETKAEASFKTWQPCVPKEGEERSGEWETEAREMGNDRLETEWG